MTIPTTTFSYLNKVPAGIVKTHCFDPIEVEAGTNLCIPDNPVPSRFQVFIYQLCYGLTYDIVDDKAYVTACW